MPWGLKRYQQARHLHFITFTCYHRAPLLGTGSARDTFVGTLERVRGWYGFCLIGYVVMPEHVHLLVSEPERGTLALAVQMIKQIVSRKLRRAQEKIRFGRRDTTISMCGANPSELRSCATCTGIR
jgi:putative transposase